MSTCAYVGSFIESKTSVVQASNVGFTSEVSDYLVVHTGPGGGSSQNLLAEQWLVSGSDTKIIYPVTLIGSMNCFKKLSLRQAVLTATRPCTTFDCKDNFGPAALSWQAGVRAYWSGMHNRCHIWSTAWQGRSARNLEEASEQGQGRTFQHWSPEWQQWRKQAVDGSPFWVGNALREVRPKLVLNRG